eukprot:6197315-Pleurochrysis_carterae.AAC.2
MRNVVIRLANSRTTDPSLVGGSFKVERQEGRNCAPARRTRPLQAVRKCASLRLFGSRLAL